MDNNETLLRAIFATLSRGTFPPGKLHRIIAPQKNSSKNLAAYNACNGNTPQREIARKAKIDPGDLSRLLSRWIDAGVMIRIGRDQFPLHVYPLTREVLEQEKEQHV